jgi:hypothetical protein
VVLPGLLEEGGELLRLAVQLAQQLQLADPLDVARPSTRPLASMFSIGLRSSATVHPPPGG